LLQWCEDLLAAVLAEGRAMCSELIAAGAAEQQQLSNLTAELLGRVATVQAVSQQLARSNQIKIDTQICTTGNHLLFKLAQSRRETARAKREGHHALENAQIDAQVEWSQRVEAARSEAEMAKENVKMIALDWQTRALQALGEVRSARETGERSAGDRVAHVRVRSAGAEGRDEGRARRRVRHAERAQAHHGPGAGPGGARARDHCGAAHDHQAAHVEQAANVRVPAEVPVQRQASAGQGGRGA